MSLSRRSLNRNLISLLVLLCFAGCAPVVSFVAIAPTAVHFGSVAYQSVEKAEIDAVVPKSVSKEDLGAITHIAIFMGGESPNRPYGRIGDLAAVVGDNLCFELARLGFKVYGWNELKKSAKGADTTDRMVKSGKALGAQAIITGSVAAGHTRSFGMLGVGRFKTIVQSATLKVIDVKTADLLMMITINYKIGQDPKVAAEGMAMVLQAKMEDPSGDLKEKLKERTEEIVRK
ncbi:MAG: hypothetical protein JRC66_04035 [Deltaproteobacteria bacterium]|nr:hypothetical protein [Deltaproteobacteria bacterium]